MPIIPIRGVGEYGVITDVRPLETPMNSWSDARNVRFKNKAVFRYSAFKKLKNPFSLVNIPKFITDASEAGSEGCLVVVTDNGRITQIDGGVTSNVSPTPDLVISSGQITTASLGSLTYLTGQADTPVYRKGPIDGEFERIPAWEANMRCKALRSYRDFLIAINITKTGAAYPNMVKWSDATQAGVPPTNWDVAEDSSLAGENVLNDAVGVLLDGAEIGPTFVLYGSEQTYRMNYIGAPFVFTFEKLFPDLGVLSQNCSVEVSGRHYVFGHNDIVIHDGVSKQSIAVGRVRDRIFRDIDFLKRERCFAFHDNLNSEILFCYPSNNSECAWDLANTLGCNEAAVYNYLNDTWSFVDLPGVVSVCKSSIPSITTWNDLGTWNEQPQSWSSFEGSAPEMPVLLSTGVNGGDSEALFLDEFQVGLLANDIQTDLVVPAWCVTSLKDFDDLGLTLIQRKLVRSVHPQVITSGEDAPMTVSVGYAQGAGNSLTWTAPREFSPLLDYKRDFRVSGRNIGFRFGLADGGYSGLFGFDVDVQLVAGR